MPECLFEKRLRFSQSTDFRKSCQQQWRQCQFWWLHFMVTDLLVFGLKPLKLLDNTNWCKSINYFGSVIIYGRTRLRLLYRCHACCNCFWILPSCLCGFWLFGSFFWWYRVKELNCDFSYVNVYFGETCCRALECIRSGRFSGKPPNPSHISGDYIIKLCVCFMLLGQSRNSKLKLILIFYKEAVRCQFLQHYYSRSSREFFEGVARMKYRLDLDCSQAVGKAGQSSHFSSQLRCEW